MSSATEGPFTIVSRRRGAFYLQRPDGTALTFPTREAAATVCDALNREDPNDEAPEYQVVEVTG